MTRLTDYQIQELSKDPNLESVHMGEILTDLPLFCLHDGAYNLMMELPPTTILLEVGDEVLVTKHKDGTYFMHFISETELYHYKAPWVTDDQVQMEEQAIYHV